MPAFMPTRLKVWKPGDLLERRCHWCLKGPQRSREMCQVFEGPVRFHFCSGECSQVWVGNRFNVDIAAWLHECPGDRVEVLKRERDAGEDDAKAQANCRRKLASLCRGDRLSLSMQEND